MEWEFHLGEVRSAGREVQRQTLERNSALQDVEISLSAPKGECGKERQWEEGRSGNVKRKTQAGEEETSSKRPTSSQKQTQGAEKD